jgi:hypothetical protein
VGEAAISLRSIPARRRRCCTRRRPARAGCSTAAAAAAARCSSRGTTTTTTASSATGRQEPSPGDRTAAHRWTARSRSARRPRAAPKPGRRAPISPMAGCTGCSSLAATTAGSRKAPPRLPIMRPLAGAPTAIRPPRRSGGTGHADPRYVLVLAMQHNMQAISGCMV